MYEKYIVLMVNSILRRQLEEWINSRRWLFIISYPGLSRFGDVEMTVGDLGARFSG